MEDDNKREFQGLFLDLSFCLGLDCGVVEWYGLWMYGLMGDKSVSTFKTLIVLLYFVTE